MTSDVCAHWRASTPAVDIAVSTHPSPTSASPGFIPQPEHMAAIVTQNESPSFGGYKREQSQRLQPRR